MNRKAFSRKLRRDAIRVALRNRQYRVALTIAVMPKLQSTLSIALLGVPDPCSYVREMYGVPAKVGARIVLNGMPGTIEGGDGAYLRLRIDSHPEWGAIRAHPTWRMEYLA